MFDSCPTRFVFILGRISSVFWTIGKSSKFKEKFSYQMSEKPPLPFFWSWRGGAFLTFGKKTFPWILKTSKWYWFQDKNKPCWTRIKYPRVISRPFFHENKIFRGASLIILWPHKKCDRFNFLQNENTLKNMNLHWPKNILHL